MPDMTIDQFIERLAACAPKFEWKLIDGAISPTDGVDVLWATGWAERDLDMYDWDMIFYAAERLPRHSPGLRKRLLKAVGLSEEKAVEK